jgi:hypothetical protein
VDRWRDPLQQVNGLPDLLEVGGAAVAGAEVLGDAVPPAGREVAVKVIADQPYGLLAGEVIRRRAQLRTGLVGQRVPSDRGGESGGFSGRNAGRAGGQGEERGEHGARAEEDPPGHVRAPGAGQGAEAERERQEEHPGEGAGPGGHPRADVGRDGVVQQPSGVNPGHGKSQREDGLGGHDHQHHVAGDEQDRHAGQHRGHRYGH